MDDIDRVIGQRIQHYRVDKLKLTQGQLRERLAGRGFVLPSNSRLSEVENGKRSLTAPQLRAVSDVLSISIVELMEPLDERSKLVGGLEDSLHDLLYALSGMAAACGALDEAGIRDVTLDELKRDNLDLAGDLQRAHPLARKWFGEVTPGLLSDGLSRRAAARSRAKAGDTRAAREAEVLRVGDKAYEHMGDNIPAELMKDPTGYTNTETIKDSK